MGTRFYLTMMKVTIAAIVLLCTIFGGEACIGIDMKTYPLTTPTPPPDDGDIYDGYKEEQQTESLEQDFRLPNVSMEPMRRKLGCKQLRKLEKKVFKICRHSKRGFTWPQVLRCERRFKKKKIPVSMPTKADFRLCDRNHDGVMTWKEWKKTIGCR